MVYALQNFIHYLLGLTFKMYTDHFALKYLVNKPFLGREYADSYYFLMNTILRLY
jgi:hypothetical protein